MIVRANLHDARKSGCWHPTSRSRHGRDVPQVVEIAWPFGAPFDHSHSVHSSARPHWPALWLWDIPLACYSCLWKTPTMTPWSLGNLRSQRGCGNIRCPSLRKPSTPALRYAAMFGRLMATQCFRAGSSWQVWARYQDPQRTLHRGVLLCWFVLRLLAWAFRCCEPHSDRAEWSFAWHTSAEVPAVRLG